MKFLVIFLLLSFAFHQATGQGLDIKNFGSQLKPPEGPGTAHLKNQFRLEDALAKVRSTDMSSFFCEMENKMNRNVKFKLYLRLGSKMYVDHLEKKGDGHFWN